MDRVTMESAIKLCLQEISQRLEQAASISKAATACAHAGNVDKGVEVALDIEQLAYEASRLLDSASLLNRLSKSGPSGA
jgi:hypothetical protein